MVCRFDRQNNIGGVFDDNGILDYRHRAPDIFEKIFPGGVCHLEIEIGVVCHHIGQSPRNMLIMADHDHWRTGKRNTGDIVFVAAEMKFIPF